MSERNMMIRVGNVFQIMWWKTIELYPKLAVIDDNNYIHQILNCRTEEEQDRILEEFMQHKILEGLKKKEMETPLK